MLPLFRSFIPLFLSCFILFLASGLANTLFPVRMELNGLSTQTIGLVLSLFFVGMLLGSIYSKTLIKRVGHIRMFAGCVTLMSASVLVCSLYSDTALWGAMRVTIGFCNACALTAMESWLSNSSTKETRGKILGIYNAVILSGLFGGQFFMGLASPEESTLFVIGGILFCIAIIPMVLGRISGPEVHEVTPMSLFALFKVSPLGVVSCFVSGIIYAALFNFLPVIAKGYGFVDFTLSTFMGAAILGAFLLQFPVGYLSDRYDRRTMLLVLLVISALSNIVITFLSPAVLQWPVFLMTAITSGIIACIYPLSVSQTFDQLKQSEMMTAMASLILAYSLGGAVGPYSASLIMGAFDNMALFYFLAVVQLLLAGFVIYRMNVREALPVEDQEHFVMQSAELAVPMELDPRTEYVEHEEPPSAEAETAAAVAETDPAAAVKLARAIAIANPDLGVEVAVAVADVEGINILRLYEVMNEAVPNQIMEVTSAIALHHPELAGELVQKLAEWYPERVVSVLIEIGRVLPELLIEMAKVAAETAPESATWVAEHYTQLVNEEMEAMRPADLDEETEQQVEEIVTQLAEVAHEHEDSDIPPEDQT